MDILGYYNKWLSTEEARTAVNVTKDGSTAFNIATALRNLNCDSEGFQPTIDEPKQEIQNMISLYSLGKKNSLDCYRKIWW